MSDELSKLRALAESDPAEFRRLMEMAKEKTVVPHAGQQLVLDSLARFKVMNCGRRWGKTVLAAKIIVSKTRKKNQMLWWVAPTYRIVKRGYAEVLRQLPEGVLAKPAPPDTNFDAGRPNILHFKNGTVMEFYSAERPEGMLGAAVDFAVLDEAARMKGEVWEQTVSPTLIDHLGGALIISTPRGRNWFYRVWLKGQDKLQQQWESWTFTTNDNPTLPPGEAERMAADMPKMEADQELYAKWLAAGSSVFLLNHDALQDMPVLPSGLIEGAPPTGYVVLGIDLARTNDYTVIYGARAKDRLNCYFERMQAIAWEEQRRRIKRAVRLCRQQGATGVLLMVDEGNAGSVIVEDLQEAGFDVVGVNFTTHKANMVRLLANDLERRRAIILSEHDCVLEFENYAMDVTEGGRFKYGAPPGEHDDIVSAKMLQHYGLVNEGIPEITVISASDPMPVDPSSGHEIDPWDPDYDPEGDDDFSDWLDDDSMSAAEAADAAGVPHRDPLSPPTAEQLLQRPDLWF